MPPSPLIKQRDLRDLCDLRARLSDARVDLAALAEEVERAELLLMHAVDTGAACERGPLTPGITEQPGRRSPKWKEEYSIACGAQAVEDVIKRTEPGPPTRKLVVMERGKAVQP